MKRSVALNKSTNKSIVTETASDDVKEKLLRLIPTYDTLATSSKIHFIQSLVSRLLLELIFDAYFVGIPKEQAEQLENIEKYLSTFGMYSSA